MLSSCLQGHLPWLRCAEFLEPILALGLAPEIAFKGPELDRLSDSELTAVARQIRASGRRPTVHAPFFDLSLGAMDPLVREVTVRRLSQALEAARRLDAHLMVIHPGYDRWRYPRLAASWGAFAAESLAPLIALAEDCDCRLALENIYEETPETLVALLAQLDSPWLGHCFDIGHWHLFGKVPQGQWLREVSPRLLHLHLHDNLGVNDDHLPVSEGLIDFAPLLGVLQELPAPPSLTLEARDPAELARSLANLTALTATEP